MHEVCLFYRLHMHQEKISKKTSKKDMAGPHKWPTILVVIDCGSSPYSSWLLVMSLSYACDFLVMWSNKGGMMRLWLARYMPAWGIKYINGHGTDNYRNLNINYLLPAVVTPLIGLSCDRSLVRQQDSHVRLCGYRSSSPSSRHPLKLALQVMYWFIFSRWILCLSATLIMCSWTFPLQCLVSNAR